MIVEAIISRTTLLTANGPSVPNMFGHSIRWLTGGNSSASTRSGSFCRLVRRVGEGGRDVTALPRQEGEVGGEHGDAEGHELDPGLVAHGVEDEHDDDHAGEEAAQRRGEEGV